MSSDEMFNPGFYAALDQGIEINNTKEKSKGRGRPRKKIRPNEPDYLLHRPTQKRERLRADPLVSISTVFEAIIVDMRETVEGNIPIYIYISDIFK